MDSSVLGIRAAKAVDTKKLPENSVFREFFGAGNVTRTHDLLITNQLLYRLSYISIFTFGVADLILTNQLLYRLSYISIFTFGVADLILTNQLLYVSIGNDEII